MDIKDDASGLNDSFDDMQEKMRSLTGSMKDLSSEGFDQLSKTITQTIVAGRQQATVRRPSEDIVHSELSKLMRQEISAGLDGIFGRKKKETPDFGAAGGTMQVIVNNNTSFSVSARETTVMNQKSLEITIDQMVADSLMRGRNTTGVLRSLFGLSPNLLGR